MPRTPTDGPATPRLFSTAAYDGFGPSLFRLADEPLVGRGLRSRQPARLRKGVQRFAPKLPGVYGMLDGKGKVVYVGKAKSLRCRLLSYFRENSRDPKAGRILEQTRTLVWEQAADEFAALLRELELIQRLGPRFNVLGRPGLQRHHYVAISKGPAPSAHVVKSPTGKEQGCYGPLVARHRSEDAVRRLNDWFRLRDCPSTVPLAFAEQGELFAVDRAPKCLRLDLGTCRGPCAGVCTRQEYAEGVRGAKAFLDGRDRSLLGVLRERMEAAAGAFEFEKAMALRDRLKAFEWLDDRLGLLRRARTNNSFVYPLAGPGGSERWYLIHRGQVRGVVAVPACAASRSAAADRIRSTFVNTPAPAVLSGGAVDSVLLVAAWFRKNAAEKGRLLSHAVALDRCGQVV